MNRSSSASDSLGRALRFSCWGARCPAAHHCFDHVAPLRHATTGLDAFGSEHNGGEKTPYA
jgi:hypothetical protein